MTVMTSAMVMDGAGVHYRQLNRDLREAVVAGQQCVDLRNIRGQRYLGTGLHRPAEIVVHGTPGNDLAAFMDGPRITVHGNAQDGCGNTMNGGQVIVHGQAGDVLGHSMRGGTIWIRDDVGYRAGIHMKEYLGQRPTIVIGGTAQHFLGEYMAGGVLVVLGLTLYRGERHPMRFIGTGMHGGVIYLRGEVADCQLGKGVGRVPLQSADQELLRELATRFAGHFAFSAEAILGEPFVKLVPVSLRPYGRLYAY